MKLKPILCSMAALSMLAMTSCQNEGDVVIPVEKPGINLTDSETVSFVVNMPSRDLRTRATEDPSMTYGEDGLFNFTRTIDKLWYAVYHDGNLLYCSLESGIRQGIYDSEDNTFSLDIQLPKINDEVRLDEYSVFFFAGNSADKVSQGEITDGIGLDFANKTLYAYPTVLSKSVADGDLFNPSQYDYFAKYVTLNDVVGDEYHGTVTLTRPFCQISLLTDELCQPAILGAYDSDYKVSIATTPSIASEKSGSDVETLPYGWNYGTDKILTKAASDLSFSLSSMALNNSEGDYTIPQEVTFKNRKMFCVASYLMLAPNDRQAYDSTADKDKFYFSLNVGGNLNSTLAYASADVPTGGLKANEKYILYNKKYNPDNGGWGDPDDPDDPDDGDDPDPDDPDKPGPGGPGGILTNHYFLDIVVDPTWEGNSNIVY